MVLKARVLVCTLLVGIWAGGCKQSSSSEPGGEKGSAASAADGITLKGAGSTFVNPMMVKWASEYQKAAPSVRVEYQSIGSGGGIRQVVAHTVTFGATDGPMTDDQIKQAGSPILHIPLVMGAVVPTYNLPPLAHPLRFTPDVLAGIFLGRIKSWNDPAIAADNGDLPLPATPIVVVHRSDGSGTTYVWADYLSKVSTEWKERVGTATSVNWPIGIGSNGNEGVAGTVQQTPGAIGYVELTYLRRYKMGIGSVKNHAGVFVSPSIESVTAAAAGAVSSIPDDLRYSITDSVGPDAYPISGTTWALVPGDMKEGPERRELTKFLRWALRQGQALCKPLDYAPLPPELVARAEAKLDLLERVAK